MGSNSKPSLTRMIRKSTIFFYKKFFNNKDIYALNKCNSLKLTLH